MTVTDRFILSTLADGKWHHYTELWFFCQTRFKKVEKFLPRLKRALEYNWIRREFNSPAIGGDRLQLTQKGDKAFREEAIRRGGDASYYKYFTRRATGTYGVGHFARRITDARR